jgi:hypothetical protein
VYLGPLAEPGEVGKLSLRRQFSGIQGGHEVLEVSSGHGDPAGIAEWAGARPAGDDTRGEAGDLAWLRHFDDEDLALFAAVVRAAGLDGRSGGRWPR